MAAIIAGRRDGQGIQGLAPGATIVSLRVDGRIDQGNGVISEVMGINGHDAVRHAADNKIPLINMSLSRSNPEGGMNTAFANSVVYYNQTAKGLIINSTGNSSEANPRNLVDVLSAAQESWLFVAALRPDGRGFELEQYSNRCGAAANRCVVAPGTNITMNINGQIEAFSGTSSAAPVVTAVAAMILSKWPQLTGVDAGNIILNSARNIGPAEIFGRGLVDAEAALRPVNPQLSNNRMSMAMEGNALVVGTAFGGMGSSSLKNALSNVTVLDAYGRDYTGSIAGMVIDVPTVDNTRMNRRVEAQMNARSAGFVSPQGSAIVGVTAFDTGLRDAGGVPVLQQQLTNAQFAFRLNSKTTLTGGFNSDNNVTTDIFGMAPTSDVMFAYSPLAQTSVGITHRIGKGKLAVSAYTGGEGDLQMNGATVQFKQGATSLKAGMVNENGTVFGAPTGLGMLRFGDGARTYFLEASSGFDVGKWSFDGYASMGRTQLRLAENMLMTHADAITTGRFGFIASRPALDGRVSFGVAQPLVVLDGEATFTVGNSYSMDVRGLLFQDRRVNLAGQMAPQFTIGYEKIGDRSDFRMGAASDTQARDVRAVASWSLKF